MTARSVLRQLAPPPTMFDRDEFAAAAQDAAVTLVSRVRDDDPHRAWAHLQDLQPSQLHAMCITLAAMVPDDRTPRQLLAWTNELGATT